MISRALVESWFKEEGNSFEVEEDTKHQWHLRVEFPKGREFKADVFQLPGRDTVVLAAGMTLAEKHFDIQRQERQTIARFHSLLKLDLLRLPVQYRLEFDEKEPNVLKGFLITRSLFGEEATKDAIFRTLADIYRAALVVIVHLEVLELGDA